MPRPRGCRSRLWRNRGSCAQKEGGGSTRAHRPFFELDHRRRHGSRRKNACSGVLSVNTAMSRGFWQTQGRKLVLRRGYINNHGRSPKPTAKFSLAKVGTLCLRGLRPIGVDLFAENDLCFCFFSVRPSNE
jgi:hypothetical protein